MTNEKILKSALDKAIKNGFDCPLVYSSQSIIFSHDFAKAFWGEEQLDLDEHDEGKYQIGGMYSAPYDGCCLAPVYFTGTEWQYHLQQMVLEEEPISYLKQFLNPKQR